MKKYLIIALAACFVALLISIKSCTNIKDDRNRLENNQNMLLDSMQAYKVRDSLNVASIGALNLTVKDLKEYRSNDVALIRDLNLRLNRVQAINKTFTQSHYDVVTTITPRRKLVLSDSLFHTTSKIALKNALDKTDDMREFIYKTPYINIDGVLHGDSLRASITTNDTLVQIFHRVPKFKFLGIWFGTKGVRQEVVSKNPHTKITYAEYIELKK